jgi:hypothetical protein
MLQIDPARTAYATGRPNRPTGRAPAAACQLQPGEPLGRQTFRPGTAPSLCSLKIEFGSPWTRNGSPPLTFGVRGDGGSGVVRSRPERSLALSILFRQVSAVFNTF